MDAAVAGSKLKTATAAADGVSSPTERAGDGAPASRLVAGAVPTASVVSTQLHPRLRHHHHQQRQQQQQQHQSSPSDSVSCRKYSRIVYLY